MTDLNTPKPNRTQGRIMSTARMATSVGVAGHKNAHGQQQQPSEGAAASANQLQSLPKTTKDVQRYLRSLKDSKINSAVSDTGYSAGSESERSIPSPVAWRNESTATVASQPRDFNVCSSEISEIEVSFAGQFRQAAADLAGLKLLLQAADSASNEHQRFAIGDQVLRHPQANPLFNRASTKAPGRQCDKYATQVSCGNSNQQQISVTNLDHAARNAQPETPPLRSETFFVDNFRQVAADPARFELQPQTDGSVSNQQCAPVIHDQLNKQMQVKLLSSSASTPSKRNPAQCTAYATDGTRREQPPVEKQSYSTSTSGTPQSDKPPPNVAEATLAAKDAQDTNEVGCIESTTSDVQVTAQSLTMSEQSAQANVPNQPVLDSHVLCPPTIFEANSKRNIIALDAAVCRSTSTSNCTNASICAQGSQVDVLSMSVEQPLSKVNTQGSNESSSQQTQYLASVIHERSILLVDQSMTGPMAEAATNANHATNRTKSDQKSSLYITPKLECNKFRTAIDRTVSTGNVLSPRWIVSQTKTSQQRAALSAAANKSRQATGSSARVLDRDSNDKYNTNQARIPSHAYSKGQRLLAGMKTTCFKTQLLNAPSTSSSWQIDKERRPVQPFLTISASHATDLPTVKKKLRDVEGKNEHIFCSKSVDKRSHTSESNNLLSGPSTPKTLQLIQPYLKQNIQRCKVMRTLSTHRISSIPRALGGNTPASLVLSKIVDGMTTTPSLTSTNLSHLSKHHLGCSKSESKIHVVQRRLNNQSTRQTFKTPSASVIKQVVERPAFLQPEIYAVNSAMTASYSNPSVPPSQKHMLSRNATESQRSVWYLKSFRSLPELVRDCTSSENKNTFEHSTSLEESCIHMSTNVRGEAAAAGEVASIRTKAVSLHNTRKIYVVVDDDKSSEKEMVLEKAWFGETRSKCQAGVKETHMVGRVQEVEHMHMQTPTVIYSTQHISQSATNETPEARVADVLTCSSFLESNASFPSHPSQSSHTSVVAKYVIEAVKIKYAQSITQSGCTLTDCIRPGLVAAEHLHGRLGVVAGDGGCYNTFKDLFDPILLAHHKKFTKSNDKSHRSNLQTHALSHAEYPASKVPLFRIKAYRNLHRHRFTPAMSADERHKVADILCTALLGLRNEVATGKYYRLAALPNDERKWLEEAQLMPTKPTDPYEVSVGLDHDWPDGRAVWFNVDRSLVAWINVREHLTLFATSRNGVIWRTIKLFATVMFELNNQLALCDRKIAKSKALGKLTAFPEFLGTAMTVLAEVRLDSPNKLQLAVQKHRLNAQCYGDVWALSNRDYLGVTEFDVFTQVIDAIRLLIE